jgi:hypothetical protein
MARDAQRDRDNGIPDYNTLRVALGLPAVTSFAQITTNVQVQQALAQAYPGGVNTIDAFEGGLAEDHVRGSDVGALFQAIMVNQFTRLRDGDRFFYLNESFNREETGLFRQGNTLAKMIEANTGTTNLQSDVFVFEASVSGTVTGTRGRSGSVALAGVTLALEDASGDVLATTRTDSRGRYSFNQLSGPAANAELASGASAVGTYKVVLVLPSGSKQIAPDPRAVVITRGGTRVAGVNFSLPLTSAVASAWNLLAHSHATDPLAI